MYLFISQFILINLPICGFHAVHSSPQPFLYPSLHFPLSLEKENPLLTEQEKPIGGKKAPNVR